MRRTIRSPTLPGRPRPRLACAPPRLAVLGFLSVVLAASAPSSLTAQEAELDARLSDLEAQVREIRELLELAAGDTEAPAVLGAHLRFGNPGAAAVPEQQRRLLRKEHFVIQHHGGWKVPLWVAYHLTHENLEGTTGRTDDFRLDAELAPEDRSELADYRHSGYDRGHMAPAASFKRSRLAMSRTFLLSNMAPQRPNLNRRIWARLEGQVRELARGHGSIWVITGALSIDADSSRIAPPDSIGPGRVAVPTHFYKVILCEHETGGREMFAFVMPNSLDPVPGRPRDFIVSVDHVERLSGLDFFSLLEDQEEDRLELASQDWPFE